MVVKSIWIVALGVMLTSVASGVWAMDSATPDPAAPPGEYELGVKAVRAGSYAAALPLLEKVVAKNADNADAWNFIGYSHRKLKRFDQALVAYQKALAIKPDHRGANEYMGELYLETGKPAKAKERLKVLDSACFFGCEEYDELKAAIAAYEAKNK
ncbi:MAG: tetratricopeptide repeat protein [Proteobacteria bacterium]|nr:tetratricopeptide repeat protein [Pseudomonadota bacterium]MDA1326957.1 tetratricopeptide repeat protein [Pseudomonadota bacterium]